MSFSSQGYAPRHGHPQIDHFSDMGLRSTSFDRPYPPHIMWNASRSDMGDSNEQHCKGFESPSPPKFRRFSRRVSGEDFYGTEWNPYEESRGNPAREKASTLTAYAEDNLRADYNPNYKAPFSGEHSPDSFYRSGFNKQCFSDTHQAKNSNSWDTRGRDRGKKRSKTRSPRWRKKHTQLLQAMTHGFHCGPSQRRPSRDGKRKHRDEFRRNEHPSCRTDVRAVSSSPEEPMQTPPLKNSSPEKRTKRHSSSPVKSINNSKVIQEKDKVAIITQLLARSPLKVLGSSPKKRESLKSDDGRSTKELKQGCEVLRESSRNENCSGEAPMELADGSQNLVKKKKKKKRNKERRKSRSRSKERRRCSLEIVKKEPLSRETGAQLTSTSHLSDNAVQGTGCSTPSKLKSSSSIKRERDDSEALDLSNPVFKSSQNVASNESNSYVCAIVKKRRTSSQSCGSAVLKFTRVDGQSRKPASPKRFSLAGPKRNQDSTPTSAKKNERTCAGIGAVTPPPENNPIKENVAQRSSPAKGDFKPKALIKPGLRSGKKEPKRRSTSPLKKDKFVQKTLESYFSRSVSKEAPTEVQQQLQTEPIASADTSKSADAGSSSRHVRRIYCDDTAAAPRASPRAVVQLTPISEGLISRLRSPQSSSEAGRSMPRTAEVRPIPSPAKKRPLESPPPAEPFKVPCRVTRATSLEEHGAPADRPPSTLGALQHEEDPMQPERDEAEVKQAAQRNRKRHTRGLKVFAFCDVLQEQIERHPVQNEIPEEKWSKWLNPAQLRCLVSAMLENLDLCLEFSLDAERNEKWEEYWLQLARRLNNVCFNDLTNLNTGLRMTVSEWKTCWIQFKTTVKTRVDAMTPKERLHNLGSLDCLLFNKDLYTALIKSKGECLGDECPKKWCPGACVGVFCPSDPVKPRPTEE